MAYEPTEVIAEVREDAAAQAAETVAPAVVGAELVTAPEVAAVGATLEEHREESEERHEEILEDTEWLRTQLGALLTNSQSLSSQMLAMQTANQAQFQAILTALESLKLRQSTASLQSTQEASAAAAPPQAEPESAEAAQPEAQTPKRKPRSAI